MSKNFIIPLHVYPFDIMVSIGESDKELLPKLKRYGVSKESLDSDVWQLSDTCKGRGTLFVCNRSLIRIAEPPKSPHGKGLLAHELFHVVDFILRRIGIELGDDSFEAYAYLIGYLTEQIYKRIHSQ